jgi:LmbE family N-acetylglucosaminyl deacetylase
MDAGPGERLAADAEPPAARVARRPQGFLRGSAWAVRARLAAAVHGRLLGRATDLSAPAGPLLVVAPHQDDETLACGGLLRSWCQGGIPAHVVFLTDGGLGGRGLAGGVADLRAVRREEARQALARLGVAAEATHHLGLPDGGLRGLPAADAAAAAAALAALVRRHRPAAVLAPFRRDRHPDHEAALALAHEALRHSSSRPPALLEYLVWGPWLAPLGTIRACRSVRRVYKVDVSGQLADKRAALAAYATQTASLPRGFVDRFLGPHELFLEW